MKVTNIIYTPPSPNTHPHTPHSSESGTWSTRHHLHGPQPPREAARHPALLHPEPSVSSLPCCGRGQDNSWDHGGCYSCPAYNLHLWTDGIRWARYHEWRVYKWRCSKWCTLVEVYQNLLSVPVGWMKVAHFLSVWNVCAYCIIVSFIHVTVAPIQLYALLCN